MEDEDEFGDLYSDVLRPFSSISTATSSLSAAPQSHQPSSAAAHLHRPIDLDLNLQSQEEGNSLFGAPRTISAAQTLASFKSPPPVAAASDSIPNHDLAPEPMILDSKQELVDGKDVKFDVEEGVRNGIEDIGSDDPIIPGLTESVRHEDSGTNNEASGNGIRGGKGDAEVEGDDWDSDSEDDLQIVLNDSNHGPMSMETRGMSGEDGDDDEDGDPLVILADGDATQGMEEQEWGEEGEQAADGERKEGGEAGKAGGGGATVVASKIGYSNHGYHPFHSQFKVSVLTC